MKILWITNILFPEAIHLLTGKGEFKSSGGWMLGAAEVLLRKDDIQLFVATVSPLVTQLSKLQGKKIIYYVLPYGKGNQQINLEYIPYWEKIKSELNPDVIHIHGTEFSHGYAYLKACGNEKVVISIQGLLSAISPYYCAGITKSEVFSNITLRDLIKGSIIHDMSSFEKRGIYEKEMIKKVNHVIGRTSWDRARTWAINPDAIYHFCNETLRSEFYDGSMWNFEKCTKHSIFLSQAGYPIKGLHQVLKALPLILQHYPDAIIRVAGENITKSNSLSDKIRLSGYGLYIMRLIKQCGLEGKVTFIGGLNASEMKQEYLNSNVFVCPSSIENSPNSLGEAQILGVPCVASYVGGIADMMRGNEENLYRFEEIAMLAEKVCTIFANKDVQVDMRQEALERHNVEYNCNQLLNIYMYIMNVNK